jgi:hypothetical protein
LAGVVDVLQSAATLPPDGNLRMSDKPSSLNADGTFEPFLVDRVPFEEYSRGTRFGVRFQSLGDFGGGSHVGVRVLGEGYRKSATMDYWERKSVDA